MATPGIDISVALRAWLGPGLGASRRRTARDLAALLEMPVRTVEAWIGGRPCSTIVAERIVLPKIKQERETK